MWFCLSATYLVFHKSSYPTHRDCKIVELRMCEYLCKSTGGVKADRIQEKTSVDKMRSTSVSAFVDFVLFLFSSRGDKTTLYSQS
jgi:hypothetical protein